MKLFENIPRSLSVPEPKVALALSGGGVRAMNFHLGALTCLAQHNLLERVVHISTVSGGSLLAGLIFKSNDWQWPSSAEFLEKCAPAIRDTFGKVDLGHKLWRAMACNWTALSYRGRVLQETIERAWEIKEPLGSLPTTPIWSINTTCMETGRRWRFRQRVRANEFTIGMGDGALGYADASRIPVAAAMAMSAAFPLLFTPLAISTARDWLKPDFDDESRTPQKVMPQYPEYHLADGGIYDNLGLEPIFDASKMELRQEVICDYLIALDGGAPLAPKRWAGLSQRVGLTTRTVDIMSSQQRHLRVRGLVNAIKAGSVKGVIARIEEPARTAVFSALKRKELVIASRAASLKSFGLLTIDEAKRAAAIRTRLISGALAERVLAERQGYETTYAQLALYG